MRDLFTFWMIAYYDWIDLGEPVKAADALRRAIAAAREDAA